jgi:hypothetical protein
MENDEVRLRDDQTIQIRNAQIGELQIVLDDCVDFLRDGDFPNSPDDVFEVLDRGRDGLLNVVWNRADQEAKRLKCRPYVAQTWREQEREAVTPEQWDKADALKRRHDHASDGLALDRKTEIHITEDGRPLVDAKAIAERIDKSCTITVTDEMKADLNHLLDIADQIKALELRGINAVELVEKFVRTNEKPADVELYKAIVFRRHAAGTIHNRDLDWVMNQVAINNNPNPLNR